MDPAHCRGTSTTAKIEPQQRQEKETFMLYAVSALVSKGTRGGKKIKSQLCHKTIATTLL